MSSRRTTRASAKLTEVERDSPEDTSVRIKKVQRGKKLKKSTPPASLSSTPQKETSLVAGISCLHVSSDVTPLKGREKEFEQLVSWISSSIEDEKPLSMYISGCPGTGKTATTKRVLEYFSNQLTSSFVNCASVSTKTALYKTIFESQKYTDKPSLGNLQKIVGESKKHLLIVLDEVDHLSTKTNSILYSTFQWPTTISSKIIILGNFSLKSLKYSSSGIANSIDLIERLLPKLMLVEAPKRIVFEPYTKDTIVDILTQKMHEEETTMDPKAMELCAKKVAAMSGDLRTALHVFKQTKNRQIPADNVVPETPKAVAGCREVLGVLHNVYSSPLARARLPLQPRLLLAVCLTLSTNKKKALTRTSLLEGYVKACDAVKAPRLDDEDLMAAFRTLEGQSFIREINGGKLVLQVDSSTARAAISDNSMLDQVFALNI